MEALGELYNALRNRAFGVALRVVRDHRLAEDAVQDAFLSVWRSAATFDADRGVAHTWVLTHVHRRAIDLVRRETRRGESAEAPPEVASECVSEIAAIQWERRRVRTALGSLPESQRQALQLAYYGGYSQSEIADRLSQPLGTIKTRMFQGLKRLRELLDELEEEKAREPEPSPLRPARAPRRRPMPSARARTPVRA